MSELAIAPVDAEVVEDFTDDLRDDVLLADGELADRDVLSAGESEADCQSSPFQVLGRVACAGCPFFDGCMRPQAVAARDMVGQQPDAAADEDIRSDGIGDMTPEILPLQPKTSYLSELLDERDGIVMAGYEPARPAQSPQPSVAPLDGVWWRSDRTAKQAPVQKLDKSQDENDNTVDVSIVEPQPPVMSAVEIATVPVVTPEVRVATPTTFEANPAPMKISDIDAVMPMTNESDSTPVITHETDPLPIVTPEVDVAPRTIIQDDLLPTPPLTREAATEPDEPTPAQLPSPAPDNVPPKNLPLEEPPREEVFADEEVSVPAAPEISATPQLDRFEAPVALPETDNFQALAALETDMFEALVAPITPATDDFEEPAAPESDQPRSVSPIVDETQDVTSEEIEPEPDQAPSLTLPLEVGAPQSHAPEVAPSRSTVLDIAPPKPTMSAVVFSQSAAPDVVASTTPEVVPLLITPPEPGETIEAQELLRDIPEELEPDIADPEEPIPDEPKTAINDSEPTTAAPDAPLVDTAPGASFSGDVSSSPTPDDTLDTPPPDNMPSLLAPDDTPEHAHQPSRLTPASVLSAVQLGIVAVWLAITRGSRNSLTVS